MRTEHTPGPWKYEWGVKVGGFTQSFDIYTEDEKELIGYVEHSDNIEANARLVATAPELLEALQELTTGHKKEGSTEWANAYTKAARAIAKATGEKEVQDERQ